MNNYSNLGSTLNSSGSEEGLAAVLAVLGVFFVFFIIVILIAVIFKIISRWVFFKKCGEEGWKALIPVYTDYTLLNISGLNWWWILIIFSGTILSTVQSTINIAEKSNSTAGYGIVVGFVGILSSLASIAALFARINQSYNITKKFKKSGAYTVLLILFEPIMLLILGLSKTDEYDSTVEVSPNGLIGAPTKKSTVYCSECGTSVQEDFCPKCGKKVR